MKWFECLLSAVLAFQALGLGHGLQKGSDEELLSEAKLLIFDEDWKAALERFQKLKNRFPESPLIPQALFFEARVLEKMTRYEDALKRYEEFLRISAGSGALEDEARYSIAKLSSQLFREGNKKYINRAIEALKSPNLDLALLAAVQLSYISEPEVSRKAVPTLKRILQEKHEAEIQNQASLALLRIDPKELQMASASTRGSSNGHLNVVLIENGKESFRLSLPLSLARLLFVALPKEAKEHLDKEGLTEENLLQSLGEKADIIEVRSGGDLFRLWID